MNRLPPQLRKPAGKKAPKRKPKKGIEIIIGVGKPKPKRSKKGGKRK